MGQDPGNDRLGSPEAAEEALKTEINHLDFSVHRSRRYHEKLCYFYEGAGRWMKIVTAVAGSGAFILLTAKWTHVAEAVTAFVALWATLDAVLSPDKQARVHGELSRQFTALARRIAVMPVSEDAFKELKAARLLLEESEPPCKRLVDLQARNDELRARGADPGEMVPLSKWQRRLGYFITFGMDRLEQWRTDRHSQTALNASRANVGSASPSA